MTVKVLVNSKTTPKKWTLASNVPLGFFLADDVKMSGSSSWSSSGVDVDSLFSRRGDVITSYSRGNPTLTHYSVTETTQFENVRVPSSVEINVTL